MTTASQELANLVKSTNFEDLPTNVVERTKELILDHCAVSAYGSTTPWAQIVVNFLVNEGAKGRSTIYLNQFKTISRNAALANGTMAHAFELDDTLRPLHAGGVVIPAALAIGEEEKLGGREFITAIVLGYEVIARVRSAIHDSKVFSKGHHGTGIIGSFGAAVAAGKMLKLDEKALVSAIGLAANQHTGLMEFYKEDTMEKRFFSGKASHDGILSAMLAAQGFTAASTSLDGEYGFCRVFDSEADLPLLTKDLGRTFRLMETAIKPYACCGIIHAQIDAAIKIAETYDVLPQDISEVIVYGNKSQASNQHAYYEIPDVMAAQYSLPFCIAKALIRRKVWVDDFTPEAIKDPQTLRFMRLIKVVYDSEMERSKGTAKMSIKTANGKTFTETIDNPRGSPENPFFREDVYNKFRTLSLIVLPEERVNNIMHLVQSLTEVNNVSEIANAMSFKQ